MQVRPVAHEPALLDEINEMEDTGKAPVCRKVNDLGSTGTQERIREGTTASIVRGLSDLNARKMSLGSRTSREIKLIFNRFAAALLCSHSLMFPHC
jgi:hypothetical protein